MTTDTELVQAASSGDPAEGLRAVRALRALADRLEALQVGRARDLGWTWQEIASLVGVSRQAVHKKYSGSDRRLFGRDK